MKVHKIKLLEDYCDEVYSGEKTFEIRKNDRGYQKGDHIRFIPVDRRHILSFHHPVSEKEYAITYVHSGLGLKNGYVVLGIEALEQHLKVAQWIYDEENKTATCSNCQTWFSTERRFSYIMRYCPYCGRKMKSEVEECTKTQ